MTHTLIWSTRNRTDIFKKSLISAHKYFPNEVQFLIVDAASNEEHLEDIRVLLSDQLHERKTFMIESPKRITVSQAWNLGMMLADTDFFIFASSDVDFRSEKLFRRFQLEYERTKSPYILAGNHSVFMLHKSIIEIIGWFDEKFGLGPHFDTDFMLRASEAGCDPTSIPAEGMYLHGDTDEETLERTTSEVANRLPMNTLENEMYFKEKWESSWPGWEHYRDQVSKPHPPNHISQAKRKLPDIDWHPSYL